MVSEEEASLLEKMADGTNFNGERGFEPGLVITNFVLNNPVHGESHFDTEDRLMHAYVNGYTVEKKKYNVKVPHTKDVWYYKSWDKDLLTICPEDKKLRGTFTKSEINHYGLQDCEKEEVADDAND